MKPAQQVNSPARVRLLVSVRDESEARLALSECVDWIDLKNPSAGALGAPSRDVAKGVARNLKDFPSRSVALGELAEITLSRRTSDLAEIASRFPVAKVGLAGAASGRDWKGDLQRIGAELAPQTQLVPVVYADFDICGAPTPSDVLHLAKRMKVPYMLVDTFTKDGRSLLDFLSLRILSELINTAATFGCKIILAGSVQERSVASVQALQPFAIAVRGAVCDKTRTGPINADKLRRWVKRFSQAK